MWWCIYYNPWTYQFSSVAHSCLTLCDPMDCMQYARLTCPSPSLRACSNSYPLSRWCHPTISSFVVPLSSCLQFFPASGYFPMSRFFASGGQSTGTSALVPVFPMTIQSWFSLELTGLISLQFKGLSRVFSNFIIQEYKFFGTQPSLWSNSHIHTWLRENPRLWLYSSLWAKWCLCSLTQFCETKLKKMKFPQCKDWN